MVQIQPEESWESKDEVREQQEGIARGRMLAEPSQCAAHQTLSSGGLKGPREKQLQAATAKMDRETKGHGMAPADSLGCRLVLTLSWPICHPDRKRQQC